MNENTTTTSVTTSSTEGGDLVLEHSADGTVLHGTSRGDRELIDLVKGQGFRWSRNLGAWFLPRAWSEPARLIRVRALRAQLGDRLVVECCDAPRRTAAEREAEKRERAAARAERLEQRAERATEAAQTETERMRRIQDAIPLGQPVLVGHHSQRRHERDLERIDRHLERAVDQHDRAEAAAAGAERARSVATGEESVVRIGNRIERTGAELRGVRRRLEGSGKAIHGEDWPVEGDYRERLLRREAELVDQLQHDQAKLAAAGGVTYGRESVKAGDLVLIRGQWYPVLRANAKTVSVPSAMLPASSTTSNTAPWREVKGHLARAEATPGRVREFAAATSPAFPGLLDRLAVIAEELVEQ